MTKIHIRDTLPWYSDIIEEVVAESGDMLGVSGKSRVDDCLMKGTTDMGIDWMTTVVPAISCEDLHRIVWEGAQRNGFAYSVTPDYSGKSNRRSVAVGDKDRTLVAFTHLKGSGFISISSHSGCILPIHTYDLDTPHERLPLPSVEEMFPNLRIVDAFDENSNLNPELSSQSEPQNGT